MIIEFKVGNFRSFKDLVTFSMVASADKEHKETHTFPVSTKLRLLKSATIYGANASGKSNLIKAMGFMRELILNSSKESWSTKKIPVDRFRLSTETDKMPSTVEMVFMIDNIRYRYGFQVDKERVHNEWLFFVPTTREATLFIRENDKITFGSKFKEGRGLDEKTRANALFLSVVDQFNGKIAGKILKWFSDIAILSSFGDEELIHFTAEKLGDKNFNDFVVKLLKVGDIGINEIIKKSTPITEDKLPKRMPEELRKFFLYEDVSEIEISTIHPKFDKNNKPVSEERFSFDENESAGTKALFAFSAPIYYALKKGKILVIDEMTSKLHPVLSRAMINIFHLYKNEKGDSPVKGQLIFAGHDTNILTNQFFRRDQVWFTEKDDYGSSELYSLEEYEYEVDKTGKVRKDASFNKEYISGKYGAIPFIGNLNSLFKQMQ